MKFRIGLALMMGQVTWERFNRLNPIVKGLLIGVVLAIGLYLFSLVAPDDPRPA
jgi:hypothetical protein